ncbi:MAG TPA: hypothetical protein VGR21_08060, partial [Cryptosporangiaceae bacterium]|nr:hypothetical protein [Cryptosporangiaceae bacterium]
LTPVATDGTTGAPSFVLHDYLAEHALGPRRRLPVPAALWEAALAHPADPADRIRLAEQVRRRALRTFATAALWTLPDAHLRAEPDAVLDDGTRFACLVAMARRGNDTALAELRALADAGREGAWSALVDALAEHGDDAAIQELRALADDGGGWARRRLVDVLGRRSDRGDDAATAELQARADSGDRLARTRLAEAADRRRGWTLALLRARVEAGEAQAQRALIKELSWRGDDAALAELRAMAATSDGYPRRRLAKALGRRGDPPAVAELRTRADAGDWWAAAELADLLASQWDEAGTAELRQEVHAANSSHAVEALLDLYAGGRPERRWALARAGLDTAAEPAWPPDTHHMPGSRVTGVARVADGAGAGQTPVG